MSRPKCLRCGAGAEWIQGRVLSEPSEGSLAAPAGSARTEDLAMLIRRLCRVVARHDANNTVRAQALDYLHRKGLGGSPLRGKAPNDKISGDAGRKE